MREAAKLLSEDIWPAAAWHDFLADLKAIRGTGYASYAPRRVPPCCGRPRRLKVLQQVRALGRAAGLGVAAIHIGRVH